MVFRNRRTSRNFQLAKPHDSLFHILIIMILPLSRALNFSLSSFNLNTDHDIVNYDGDALPVNGYIGLTKNQIGENQNFSFGQVTCKKPLHLWDKQTRKLTDFITHFSFVIDSSSSKYPQLYGDGLAFFLAPEGSQLLTPDEDNRTQGSSLGLTRDYQQQNTSANHFVAVEFDIYSNSNITSGPRDFTSDPPGEHVGIDINSLKSVKTIPWDVNVSAGHMNEATVTYNSSTCTLTVHVVNVNSSFTGLLNWTVDLRNYLPEWVTFGFTAAAGNNFAMHKILSWEFNATTLVDNNRDIKDKTPLAVGLGVGCALFVVVVLSLVWLIVVMRRNKFNGRDEDDVHVLEECMDEEFEQGTGAKKFSYHELAQATDNFNDEQKLGQGGFGGVYKGFLKETNAYIAVKRVSRESKQGIKEYAAEVKIISRLRHRNLVQLIGWCHEKKELLLVYEFLPNGSLDSHLFKEKSFLTWDVRYKIAKGLASGLHYLHEEWEQCVVHRDIKSSNTMLDSEFNAKLGDFGLARLVDHVKGSQTTILAGTMGYMAPECATTGKASKESDVYSFGVVALEIACGRKPIDPKATEAQMHMVKWVWELYGTGKLLEATDPRLGGDFHVEQMERLMIVGLACAHPDEKLRPSIGNAIQMLKFEAPLPILPSKMPVPTYSAPPLSPSLLLHSYGSSSESGGGKFQSSSYSYNSNSSKLATSSEASSSSAASLLHNTL